MVLVSLKALHLSDVEVIQGLEAVFSPFGPGFSKFSFLIARYYPPNQIFDDPLVVKLQMPGAGRLVECNDYIYRGGGGEVVPLGPSGLGGASLVLSPYAVERRP